VELVGNFRISCADIIGEDMLRYLACVRLFLGAILLAVYAVPARAALSGSATISTSQTSAPFTYSITLHNTGTTNIGSFWFAWNPSGYDFLATQPLSVTPPTGWTDTITNLYPGYDGYGLEFVDTGAPLAAGGTLTGFKFTSNDTPAQLAGNSIWYPSPPVGTSYIYQGAPEAPGDPGALVIATVTTVPEPPTFLLAIVAGILGLLTWRRQRAATTISL
jgi:hypothetical protein